MAETPLSFLISRAKWSKLCLIQREIMLAVVFRIRKLLNSERDESGGSQSANTLDDIDGFDQVVAGKFPNVTAKQFTWEYQCKVPVSAGILSLSAINYYQDRHVDDSEVHTDHTYQLAEVSNASICTNGATHVSIYGADDWCLPEYSYVKYGRNRPKVRNKQRHLAIDRLVPGLTLNLYGNVENTAGN